jgi:phosphoglycerate dehydrogenase-like enzyme
VNSGHRVVVVTPPRDGWQALGGTRRYLHGGDRYRSLADEVLAPYVDVRHLVWKPTGDASDGAALDAALRDADGIVFAPWFPEPSAVPFPILDAPRLRRGERLRAVAGTFDFRLRWIDLPATRRRSIAVIDTSRTMTPTVAEFGVAITLALLRDIPLAIDLVRRGEWLRGPMEAGPFVFGDLADRRVGLAGYGSINRHYRRFTAPYGCEVRAYDPFVPAHVFAADGVRRVRSLRDLARWSEVFVVAIPPTPTSLGIVSDDVIDALPTGSLFVLLSRMAVVAQERLWRRVRAGELKAAIDVFDPEPPPANAWFRRAPNVLPTPHIAGNTRFAHERCFTEACRDVLRILRGSPPHHKVTLRDQRLYEGALGQRGRTTGR